MMFSIANPLLKSMVVVFVFLLGASAEAPAVTVHAGETYIGTFDLTGFTPDYDPSGDSGYHFSISYLSAGQNTLDTVFYSEGGTVVITSELFSNLGLCCGQGVLGSSVLGSNFYWIIQGLGGEVEFNASIDQARNIRPAIWTQVAPVPIPAALLLLAFGLGALGLVGWRRNHKPLA